MTTTSKLKKSKGIYLIRNTVNGKVYVGSTRRNFYDRFCAHKSTLKRNKHSSIVLQRSFNKHGMKSFKFHVLASTESTADISSLDLSSLELSYIKLFKSDNPKFGYNISTETANARLGKPHSKKTRLKISNALRGITRSKQTRKAMSASKTGPLNPSFNRRQQESSKKKRTNRLYKSILREDGKIYISLKEAAADLKVTYQNVSQAVRKGYKCAGYRLRYAKKQ
jgi:group I intron endonuclease